MGRHSLTPRFILRQFAAGFENGRFQAATLFVDISGFTTVTERLMQHGKPGAEALADIMAAIFTPLIAAAYEQGGFVVGFAGDAFTVVFPGRGVRAKARAAMAAWQMQQRLATFAQHSTPFGTFAFKGRVGVAAGGVRWGVLGNTQRRVAYFRGGAIDACAAAEHAAGDDEIVLTSAVATALVPWLHTEAKSTAHWQLKDWIGSPKLGTPAKFTEPLLEKTAVLFQPATLLEMEVKGEFRQVVSLFINLRGNPRSAALATFMRQAVELLTQFGGYLCRLDFGDKGCNLLLFWGAPTSFENDVSRALNFILALRAATTLTLRVGLTYCQAFAGFAGSPLREEYTCYGLGINQAARQMMAAAWDEIWLDEALATQATGFEVAEVGRLAFKGFSQPQRVFRLLGQREGVRPFYQQVFAGREAELALLRRAMQPLANGRFGGVLLVSGEAGIGKSRLVNHFLQEQMRGQLQLFVGQTDEILRRGFNPFRYWLRRYFGQSVAADEATNKAAFEVKLSTLMESTLDEATRSELFRIRSFLGALVDLFWSGSLYDALSPELRRANSMVAVKSLLLAEAACRPTVLLLEDVQWLDAASQELLQRLPRHVEDVPLLLLLTSREAEVKTFFAAETAVQHLPLGKLTEEEIGEMAHRFWETAPPPALLRSVVARAEGNPFFLEQQLLFLRDQAVWDESAGSLLPQTVQALLVARLDALAREVRAVVQTAAVLGREFDVQVLSEMLRYEASVAERVAMAEKAAVWSALSELTYLFRHALLRDAAYEMQLQTRLQLLHRTAAQAFETLFITNLTTYAEPIGYHFEQAGDIPAAIPYWQMAANTAQQNYQNETALLLLGKIVAHYEQLGFGERLAVRRQQAEILILVGQLEQAKHVLQAVLAEAEEARDEATTIAVLNQLGELYHYQGNFGEVMAVMTRSLVLAQQVGDMPSITAVYRELGNAQEGFGNYEQAARYYEQGFAICEQLGDSQGSAQAKLNLGLMAWYQGNYDQAEQLYLASLQGFEAANDRYGQGKAYNNLGSVALGRQDNELALHYYQRANEQFIEIGSYLGQSITLGNLGSITSTRGDFVKGIAYFQQALAICQDANDQYGIAHLHCNLGWNFYMAGRPGYASHLYDGIWLALKIEADAVVLEGFNMSADIYCEIDQALSYRLAQFVKGHPANHAEMLSRLAQVDAKIVLTAEERQVIDTAVSQQTLAEVAEDLLLFLEKQK